MSFHAIILAGQRDGPDDVCRSAGVSRKADFEIAGRTMLAHVDAALTEAGVRKPVILSAYPSPKEGYRQTEAGPGPADSALLAMAESDFPVLLTSCDHPVLTGEIIRDFVAGAQASGADFAVGLVDKADVLARYPDSQCTYWTFSDAAVSNCDLFYFANERGLKAIEFWQSVQHLRRQPAKILRKVGFRIALRYAFGRVSLDYAFDYASRKLGIDAKPVRLSHPEAAIDVDSLNDLAIVRRILSDRDPS